MDTADRANHQIIHAHRPDERLRAEDFTALLEAREGRHHEAADQLMIELILGA